MSRFFYTKNQALRSENCPYLTICTILFSIISCN
jgi:hypothetical protein